MTLTPFDFRYKPPGYFYTPDYFALKRTRAANAASCSIACRQGRSTKARKAPVTLAKITLLETKA